MMNIPAINGAHHGGYGGLNIVDQIPPPYRMRLGWATNVFYITDLADVGNYTLNRGDIICWFNQNLDDSDGSEGIYVDCMEGVDGCADLFVGQYALVIWNHFYGCYG